MCNYDGFLYWQIDWDLRLACLLLYAFDRDDNFWQLYGDFLPSADECTSLLLATEVRDPQNGKPYMHIDCDLCSSSDITDYFMQLTLKFVIWTYMGHSLYYILTFS